MSLWNEHKKKILCSFLKIFINVINLQFVHTSISKVCCSMISCTDSLHTEFIKPESQLCKRKHRIISLLIMIMISFIVQQQHLVCQTNKCDDRFLYRWTQREQSVEDKGGDTHRKERHLHTLKHLHNNSGEDVKAPPTMFDWQLISVQWRDATTISCQQQTWRPNTEFNP